jgi:hypothetical protein
MFKGGNTDNFCARVVMAHLSHMFWLMTRNLYLKFEVNTLRNKELIVKKLKKLYLKFEVNTLRNKELIVRKLKKLNQKS